MSRLYEMEVSIEGFDPDKKDEIQDAAHDEWPFEDWQDWNGELSCHAQSNLGGGETDDQFARRLSDAIIEANGKPCYVKVDATLMENLPYETFEFNTKLKNPED